jgi:hypothetical protein
VTDGLIHGGTILAILAIALYVGRQQMKIRLLWKHYCKTVLKEEVDGE